jgi:lipoyl(octanoyl) transferase
MMSSAEAIIARAPVEWAQRGEVPYPEAITQMEARVDGIVRGCAGETVWLLAHPPLYTAGTSAKAGDLLDPLLPVFRSGRGGQYTYHGPGQRIAYVMLDLKARTPDVRRYVHDLEEWLIRTFAILGVKGERRAGRVGIWVKNGSREDKIAAIGVRIRHWVTFHGVSLNVNPNLSHYAGIVPCGERDRGVTSLAALGVPATMDDADAALKAAFVPVFGPISPG